VRILILNWRCPSNPRAGGAEFFTHGVARRLVEQGDEVEWFSGSFPGGSDCEEVDGIRMVRGGTQWSVHFSAYRRYRKSLRERFDVVIDEINTIPFFTPIWAPIPCFVLIHQLAREVWWYESKFPLSALGYVLEPWYLKLYRRVPSFTVSDSTRKDLLQLGFSAPITVVPEGLEKAAFSKRAKSSRPTFIYVGRVSPSKRVEDVILAFQSFHHMFDTAQLWLVGDGPRAYRRKLLQLVDQIGLTSDVEFLGHLDNRDKHEKMAQAHMLLMTSVREGWGLVVSEGNAVGTPAVAYNVPGLRDSVVHEKTGLLTETSPTALASAMIRLWRDPKLYDRLVREGSRVVTNLSFDRAAELIRSELIRATGSAGSALVGTASDSNRWTAE